MECPSCQHPNPAPATSCAACGAPLSPRCSQCGQELPASSRFCLRCGAPVGSGKPFEQHERRQVTVMFCDLVESTVLADRLDPEDLLDVMRRYQAVVAGIVERYGGHVAQYLGDGVLVYFGYPVAHEDDARRAVTSGLEVAEAVARLSETLEYEPRVALAVRIGLHTGPVVAGEVGAGARTEQLALGATPNVAARVQALAAPGELLLTEASYRLVERHFECSCLGPQTLRGLSEPIVLYRAHQRTVQSGGRSAEDDAPPLVGREKELASLLDGLARAERGEGGVVLLCGEPGIGKTRLHRELRRRVESRTGAWLVCACSAYHQNSALYPVIEQLERAFGRKPGDDGDAVLDKLEAWLESLEVSVAEMAAPLAALLSLPMERYAIAAPLSPERQRRQLLSLLIGLVRHLARRKPVVVAVEDLQWADPSTRELLQLLAGEIEHHKVLAIVTTRDESIAGASWPNTQRVELARLDPVAAEAMLDGFRELSPDLRREVLARTDGVPLFLEELTRAVLADAEVTGARRRSASEPLIPTTLRNSLMARLDGLGPAKETAQLAALLGRSFRHEILDAVSPVGTAMLRQHLRQLVDSGLLEVAGSPPDATYTFRQSLIQDTAYESMLRSRRRQLHDHVARVLHESFPGIARSEPETLARHFEAAGRWPEALEFHKSAGNRVLERGAYVESIASLRRALALLEQLAAGPDRDRLELGLLQLLVIPIFAHHGYAAPELPGIYARIRELTRDLGGSREEAWQLLTSWGFHLVRSDRTETAALAEEMVALAKRAPEVLTDAQLGYVLGYNAFYGGDQARALEEFGRAIKPAPGGIQAPLASIEAAFMASLARGWSLAVAGHPQEAWQALSASVAAAEAVGQPFGVAQALSYMAATAQDLGRDPREVRELAERVLAIAEEQELVIWICFGHIFRGWARAMLGEETGVDEIRDAIDASLAGGHLTSMGHSLLMRAAALEHLGRSQEALETVEQALAFGARHLERFSEPDAHRVRGELLWRRGEREAAESSLRTALSTARDQHARLYGLRAATSFALLMEEQGRHAEGRACLAEHVAEFGEESECRWLHEAQAALARLAAAGGAASAVP